MIWKSLLLSKPSLVIISLIICSAFFSVKIYGKNEIIQQQTVALEQCMSVKAQCEANVITLKDGIAKQNKAIDDLKAEGLQRQLDTEKVGKKIDEKKPKPLTDNKIVEEMNQWYADLY